MKNLNIFITVLLSFFVLSVSYGQEGDQATGSMKKNAAPMSKVAQEIVNLENSISQAVKNKDTGQFGSFLSDDFQAVYDTGILTKDQEIQRIQNVDLKDTKRTDEKLIFPAENVAILTYKSSPTSTNNGVDMSGTYNVSSTFVKRNGKWVAVEHMRVKATE